MELPAGFIILNLCLIIIISVGTICKDILEKWQLCATEQQYDEPNINSSVNQQQNEDLIVQLYPLLGE